MQGDWKRKLEDCSQFSSTLPLFVLAHSFSQPVLPALRRGAEEMSMFLEPILVCGWIEKGTEHVPLRYRNMDRTSKTSPAALRGNITVSESRNRLFRENICIFKSQIGKDQQGKDVLSAC